MVSWAELDNLNFNAAVEAVARLSDDELAELWRSAPDSMTVDTRGLGSRACDAGGQMKKAVEANNGYSGGVHIGAAYRDLQRLLRFSGSAFGAVVGALIERGMFERDKP